MRTSYSFAASWVTEAPLDDVAATVLDLERYPEWWPQVRAVARISDDSARVLCRSALPYTLDLVLDALSREAPVLEVAVTGDLDGWVRWTLTPEGPDRTRTDFTQAVAVDGALALASYVARPLLSWNHHRMMRGCENGLRARLGGTRG
ncbi:polyketide cyclase [Nocardioides silvaticus]|uniref:Polyketide cyclase n=1 Tax=Nocardioides silvaticus TaxID=2201891 RepID=A0A316TQQ4_9ACTN|nr:SRPBCC family protein [Nocardioides silvaticus]PWN04562.1 polyketide cyclase [Nocardioides silvaticus]